MPMADLKGDGKLVRFKWSYHKDIVTVYGYDACPTVDPLQITKFKKTDAQKLWKSLVARGYKHIGTYEPVWQTK